jgi:hypothetical protein
MILLSDDSYQFYQSMAFERHAYGGDWRDLEDPSQSAAFEKDFGPDAAGSSWELQIATLGGPVMVDDYYELRCEGFR